MKEVKIQPGQSNDIKTCLNENDWYTKLRIDEVKKAGFGKAKKYYEIIKRIAPLKYNSDQDQFFQLCFAHYIISKEGAEVYRRLSDPELDASRGSFDMMALDEENYVNNKAASRVGKEVDEKRQTIGSSNWEIESAANRLSNIFLNKNSLGKREFKQVIINTVAIINSSQFKV
jgi:hypothetical protein